MRTGQTGQRIDIRQTERAEAVMRLVRQEELPFEGVSDGLRISRVRSTLTYEGGLGGEGILEEFKACFTDQNATMTGLQQVRGKLGEFEGSFVFNTAGKVRNGMVSGTWIVMPGSATDGLKGLRGKMTFHVQSLEAIPVTFDYYFA